MFIGFLASHNGSSARAVVDAIRAGRLAAQAACMISNNKDSVALQWAAQLGLPTYHLSSNTHPDPNDLDTAICGALTTCAASVVVLSGYMKKLGRQTLAAFEHRILNVHPSLLPKHGGQGMYGDHVHTAVLDARESTTGITVHLVDEHYDHGRILAQCRVPVLPGDTVERLRARVQEREKTFYVQVLQDIAEGRIQLG